MSVKSSFPWSTWFLPYPLKDSVHKGHILPPSCGFSALSQAELAFLPLGLHLSIVSILVLITLYWNCFHVYLPIHSGSPHSLNILCV